MQPTEQAALAATLRARVLSWPIGDGGQWFDNPTPTRFNPFQPGTVSPRAAQYG